MIEVKKKDNESVGSLLRRFSRKVQQSGLLLQARSVRFQEKTRALFAGTRSWPRRKETANWASLKKNSDSRDNIEETF